MPMSASQVCKHAIEMARNNDAAKNVTAIEYKFDDRFQKVHGLYAVQGCMADKMWFDTGITMKDAEEELAWLEHLEDIHQPVELPEYFF